MLKDRRSDSLPLSTVANAPRHYIYAARRKCVGEPHMVLRLWVEYSCSMQHFATVIGVSKTTVGNVWRPKSPPFALSSYLCLTQLRLTLQRTAIIFVPPAVTFSGVVLQFARRVNSLVSDDSQNKLFS